MPVPLSWMRIFAPPPIVQFDNAFAAAGQPWRYQLDKRRWALRTARLAPSTLQALLQPLVVQTQCPSGPVQTVLCEWRSKRA